MSEEAEDQVDHYSEANTPDETPSEIQAETRTLLSINLFVALVNLVFMGITIYFLIKRDVRDEFVRRALIFLVVATMLRIVMSTGAAVQRPDAYSSLDNVPLQQIYFEVPFYAFVVVTIALMASWY
jgi:hypothetical protein